jgi:hypothetical protein
MIVEVITYGGIITTIKTPDKAGRVSDVTLGFDTLSGKFQRQARELTYTLFNVGLHAAKSNVTCNQQHQWGSSHPHGPPEAESIREKHSSIINDSDQIS